MENKILDLFQDNNPKNSGKSEIEIPKKAKFNDPCFFNFIELKKEIGKTTKKNLKIFQEKR